jgi:hypothetical protein
VCKAASFINFVTVAINVLMGHVKVGINLFLNDKKSFEIKSPIAEQDEIISVTN